MELSSFVIWHGVEILACLVTLASMWFYARKSVWGPILSVLDFFPWTAIAVHSALWFMVGYNVIVTLISAFAWYRWTHPST